MIFGDKLLRSPFELDEPKWQIDSQHTACGKCSKKFSITNRRHHCRRCGNIFCGGCCAKKISLPRLAFVDPQRVCQECTPVALHEKGFYDKHIRHLQKGAALIINDTGPLVFLSQLDAKSHREIVFKCTGDGLTAAHDPLVLSDVISLQTLTNAAQTSSSVSSAQTPTAQITGIVLKYRKDDGTEEVKLSAPGGSKEAIIFLVVLQEAIKMLFDAP